MPAPAEQLWFDQHVQDRTTELLDAVGDATKLLAVQASVARCTADIAANTQEVAMARARHDYADIPEPERLVQAERLWHVPAAATASSARGAPPLGQEAYTQWLRSRQGQ